MHSPTNPAEAETTKIQKKIMLKFYYAAETDIPDDLKGAYEAKNGRYELIKLADDVPVVVHNKTILSEKNTVETELGALKANVSNIEHERDELKNKVIPSGYRTVTKQDAELLEAIKPLGLKADELAVMKTENEKYKQETETRDKENFLAHVADSLKLNRKTFIPLAKDLNITAEKQVVDGKETDVFYAGRDGDKRTLNNEYFEQSETFKPFLGVLSAEEKKEGFKFGAEGGKNAVINPVDMTMAKYSPPASAAIKQN